MTRKRPTFNYSTKPFFIYWEITRSCDLACKHCRAEAIYYRNPNELSTQQCFDYIKDIAKFKKPWPHLVITGGDPLKRPDLFEIIAFANKVGVPVSLAPSGTNNLTRDVVQKLKDLKIGAISLSIDGSNARRHDAFRGVEGCYNDTRKAIRYIKEAGIPLQINTLVCGDTINDLPAIYRLIRKIGIIRWSVFFLINVGRGKALKEISQEQAEYTMHWIYKVSQKASFSIKTTEAPQYRRIVLQHLLAGGMSSNELFRQPIVRGFGIRDGNGILFTSHTGDVYPSGFLPVKAGNVKTECIVDIYKKSEVFTDLRKPDTYLGKCGYCEFRKVCGGSRARAYANSENYMTSDPLCSYHPNKKRSKKQNNLWTLLKENDKKEIGFSYKPEGDYLFTIRVNDRKKPVFVTAFDKLKAKDWISKGFKKRYRVSESKIGFIR